MATGMEMMLKAFGIKPEEITKTVSEMGKGVVEMKAQADRIEAKLDLVLTHLGLSTSNEDANNGQ